MKTIAAITPSARNGMITTKTLSEFVYQAWMPFGIELAIEAKIISEMPLPMPRWVISSPIHISSTQPAVRQMTISSTLPSVKFGISAVPAELPWLLNR
jgi:hypothetical protein